jgi:oligo-1,6-glucosidase
MTRVSSQSLKLLGAICPWAKACNIKARLLILLELGMTNIRFTRIEEYDDIDTRNHYRKLLREGGDTEQFLREQQEIGRDNARTPYQWDGTLYAGFSTAKPWLRVNPNHTEVNAARELCDPDSVLNFFRRVVTLRKEHPDLVYGSFRLVDADNPQVFAYLREGTGRNYLTVLNFSPKAARFDPKTDLTEAMPLLHNYPAPPIAEKEGPIELRPYEGILYRLA